MLEPFRDLGIGMLIHSEELNQLGQARGRCLLPEPRKSWLIIDKYRYQAGTPSLLPISIS